MHSSALLLALLGLAGALSTVQVSQGKDAFHPSEYVAGRTCQRAFKAVKSSLNANVPDNQLFSWQPTVPAWWKTNQNDLLQQIVIVHSIASDDFDDYVMWVADHPGLPDDQKKASYLAAQRILDAVKAAKINGPWGAFHLVTRVFKWLLLNPKPVNKWKKYCFEEEYSHCRLCQCAGVDIA